MNIVKENIIYEPFSTLESQESQEKDLKEEIENMLDYESNVEIKKIEEQELKRIKVEASIVEKLTNF